MLSFKSVFWLYFPFLFSHIIGYSIQVLKKIDDRARVGASRCSLKTIFQESLSFEYLVNRYSVKY